MEVRRKIALEWAGLLMEGFPPAVTLLEGPRKSAVRRSCRFDYSQSPRRGGPLNGAANKPKLNNPTRMTSRARLKVQASSGHFLGRDLADKHIGG